MQSLNQIVLPPPMSPASDRLLQELNTEEHSKFTRKIFDISQVTDMIEYHRKNYNYNIKFARIGKVVISEDTITFILG